MLAVLRRRILPMLLLASALPLTALPIHAAADAAAAGTEFRDGRWFNGTRFVPGTWYAVDGRFTRQAPARITASVDLHGGHVVPPFAEAHNHNLQNRWGATRNLARYVEAGVMYAAMLCGSGGSAAEARAAMGPRAPIDVLFASACISSSDGHPLRMARRREDGSLRPAEDVHDKDYIVMDTVADVARKWPLVRTARPDLVKAILVHSERPERRGNPDFHGINGLRPEVLPALVRRARADGVRVVAHTESAADFRVAVEAGVDWIGHLPGYHFWDGMDERDYRLDDASIAMAAERGIAVIATANVASMFTDGDPAALARVQALQRGNLSRLAAAGVPIAIGSDRYGATSVAEYLYLHELGIMSPLALLRAMVEYTPRLLYPGRRIGRIAEGYEASFLVLDGNPLEDPGAVERVTRRVRQGRLSGQPDAGSSARP